MQNIRGIKKVLLQFEKWLINLLRSYVLLLQCSLCDDTQCENEYLQRCFISRLHDERVISRRVSRKGHYMLIKCNPPLFEEKIITHALPVPLYREVDFIPKRVVVLHLNDTVARFCARQLE